MVDHMTKGRVKFGVGRGYHTREVETLGGPMLDKEANREIFEEQIEIIFKAFNEDSFSHESEHYTIPARVPYRGYQLEKLTPGAASVEPPRRMLATGGQREPIAAWTSCCATASRASSAAGRP